MSENFYRRTEERLDAIEKRLKHIEEYIDNANVAWQLFVDNLKEAKHHKRGI